ncbi:MAG: hypothetical protein KAS11_04325 [Candidatus Aenigmarchaeota archaeon]|nr:hypothetical protein [Candidatus Aenigmarchaeota archaeon]
MEEYLEMKDKIEDKIINRLEDLINPGNAVSSLSNKIDGIYGFDDWYKYTGSKIAAISVAAMIAEDNETSGTEIYESILSYVEDNLISLTEEDYDEVNKAVSRVSLCYSGVEGRGEIYEILKNKGFFEGLNSVYATLEIFTSMFISDDPLLSMESADLLKKYCKKKYDEIDKEIRDSRPTKYILPLRRKKFQRNKYRALYENADAGYQNAMQLIKGLDVEKIKQAITDNEIGYIKP